MVTGQEFLKTNQNMKKKLLKQGYTFEIKVDAVNGELLRVKIAKPGH